MRDNGARADQAYRSCLAIGPDSHKCLTPIVCGREPVAISRFKGAL